jgi:hypothetical protein
LDTAVRPPKRLVRLFTSSSMFSARK